LDRTGVVVKTAADVARWLRTEDADRIISGHQLGGNPGHCMCGRWLDGPRRWRRTLAGHLFDVLAEEIEQRSAGQRPSRSRRASTPQDDAD
jgi:hypothetical protein